MKKKSIYLFIFVVLLVTLSTIQNKLNDNYTKDGIFVFEKININNGVSEKMKNEIDLICKDKGVFLFESVENNEIYLIFDSRVNLEGEAPYFSHVKIEAKENTIEINFNEKSMNYPSGKYPEPKLVYRITKDKNYEYIRVFKNGEESHFDGIGA